MPCIWPCSFCLLKASLDHISDEPLLSSDNLLTDLRGSMKFPDSSSVVAHLSNHRNQILKIFIRQMRNAVRTDTKVFAKLSFRQIPPLPLPTTTPLTSKKGRLLVKLGLILYLSGARERCWIPSKPFAALLGQRKTLSLWSRIAKNTECSTGHSLVCLLVRSWESELLDGYFVCVFFPFSTIVPLSIFFGPRLA